MDKVRVRVLRSRSFRVWVFELVCVLLVVMCEFKVLGGLVYVERRCGGFVEVVFLICLMSWVVLCWGDCVFEVSCLFGCFCGLLVLGG